MMGKITFFAGAGIGFVLGSRAGEGPYQQIEAKAREIAKRPSVQQTAQQLKSTAGGQVDAMAGAVSDNLPSSEPDTPETITPTVTIITPEQPLV